MFVHVQCAPWFFPWKVIIIKYDLFNFPKTNTCVFNRECWLYFHRHAMGTGTGSGPLSPQGREDSSGAGDSRQDQAEWE